MRSTVLLLYFFLHYILHLKSLLCEDRCNYHSSCNLYESSVGRSQSRPLWLDMGNIKCVAKERR